MGDWRTFNVAICALSLCSTALSPAQDVGRSLSPAPATKNKIAPAARKRTLNKSDRSSLIAVALNSKKNRPAGRDCSHLVHSIYEHAGFPYPYADSEDLYDGVEKFQRVEHPRAADLVVWHGHVGIVIRPSGHRFFSLLSTGPGIDDYQSRYWKRRGRPRFYRYVKNDS